MTDKLSTAVQTIINDKRLPFHSGAREALRDSFAGMQSAADLLGIVERHFQGMDLAIANASYVRMGERDRKIAEATSDAWLTIRDALGLPNYNRPRAAVAITKPPVAAHTPKPISPPPPKAAEVNVAPPTPTVRAPIEAQPPKPTAEDAEMSQIRSLIRDAALPGFRLSDPPPDAGRAADPQVADVLALIQATGLPGFKSSAPDADAAARSPTADDDTLALIRSARLPGFKSRAPSG